MRALKILVVDDDASMHELYRDTFIDDGHVLCSAYNGTDGVHAYVESYESEAVPSFDIVIMDGQMPVMGGYEAIELIIDHDPRARIVMFSWAPNHRAAVTAGALGAHTKTYDTDELKRIVMSYVESSSETADGDDLEDAADTNDGEPTPPSEDDRDAPDTWPGDTPFPPQPHERKLHASPELTAALRRFKEWEPEPEPELTWEEQRAQQEAQERADTIAGMRKLLDILEENPHVKMPYAFDSLSIYFFNGEDNVKEMTETRRLIGGKWDKEPSGEYFNLVGRCGGVKVTLVSSRKDVCQRVVVGSREVYEDVPDPDLVAKVPLKRVSRTVEDVEWICPETLVSD